MTQKILNFTSPEIQWKAIFFKTHSMQHCGGKLEGWEGGGGGGEIPPG